MVKSDERSYLSKDDWEEEFERERKPTEREKGLGMRGMEKRRGRMR